MTTRTHHGRPARRPGARSGWPVAVLLVLLSAVPLSAGALRLLQLSGGPHLIPADPRFDAVPLALVTHIVASAVFALVGVLQFLPRFRRRHRRWHRRSGRVLVVAGLLVAGSALWMTLFYPAQPHTGPVLLVLRLGFASAMAACLFLGLLAVRRRDVTAHRAWMIRGYALALGAGTQALTEGFGVALLGDAVLTTDLLKGAGWAINLAVAELAVRAAGPARRRPSPGRPAVAPAGVS